jgi:hypothetical protein
MTSSDTCCCHCSTCFFRAAVSLPLVTNSHFLSGKISGASMAEEVGKIDAVALAGAR